MRHLLTLIFGVTALGVLGDGGAGSVTVTGILNVIIPGLGSIIGFLAGTSRALKNLANQVSRAFTFVWAEISGAIFATLRLLQTHILALIARLRGLFQWLHDHLKNIIGPIIAHAKAIRDLWDNLFKRFIAPIIQTIQHVRQTLEIFKVFHVKWATALDSRLAKLEGQITSYFLKVTQELNKAITLLTTWTDPTGFIRATAIWRGLLGSLTGLGALVRGFAFGPIPENIPSKKPRERLDDANKRSLEMITRFRTGSLTDQEKQLLDDNKALMV